MNKQPTLNLIQQRFGNLTESATNIVRAEYRHHDVPLGVYYFDFNQAVTDERFNLPTYLQENIATDFYRHEGSLQWNYYLYFVLEPAAVRKMRITRRAAQIEADKSFARKFIRDADTLEKEISQPLATTLHSTNPSQDIASRWVEALNEAGLSGVADPNSKYAPIIRKFLDGTAKENPPTKNTPKKNISNGRFIRELQLKQFRPHPTQKSFNFGTVNLIRGVNGTGKTSLLEAIELCICGGIRRQRGKCPSGAKLQIQFQGQSKALPCPASRAALYRERDLAWYGGYYLQGNRMFDNFGRFNFFDSDAATLLSSATSGEIVLKAINTLLLGDFANTLEERMTQCKERFAREERDFKKLVLNHRKDFAKAIDDLKQIKTIKDTREVLVTELHAKGKECGWKKVPTKPKLKDLALMQESVSNIAERLAQNTRNLPWIALPSIASLRSAVSQIAETEKELKKLKKTTERHSASLEKDSGLVAVLENEIETLSRLKAYHIETDAMSLMGCSRATELIRVELARFKEAAALTSSLNLKPFEQSMLTLEEYTAQKDSEITRCRRDLSKLANRASELQTQIGKINSVVEEIKGLGRHFCDVNPTSNTCPLCDTTHEDLRNRIASLSFESSLDSPLEELTAKIARNRESLDEFQRERGAIEKAREAAHLFIKAEKLVKLSLKVIVEDMSKLSERVSTKEAELDLLVAKEKHLKLAGFTERELDQLFAKALHEHQRTRSQIEKVGDVKATLSQKRNSLETLRTGIKAKEKVVKKSIADLQELIELRLGTDIDDPTIELERRQGVANEVLEKALQTKNHIDLDESESFTKVSARLKNFAKTIQRIQETLKRLEEKDVLEQRLTKTVEATKHELQALEPKLRRAKTATKTLGKLLSSDYKDAYLQKMNEEYKQRLVTFFSRIHAPHEFKDIHFGKDVLLERDTGTNDPVSEISTGQRAALALSIFLGLNSSVSTRAPWLIFDDPIAHIDDINVLSFLDMLRDLVLLGDRQVFFATANKRVADLFARKFDCLGGEFQEIHLQR